MIDQLDCEFVKVRGHQVSNQKDDIRLPVSVAVQIILPAGCRKVDLSISRQS